MRPPPRKRWLAAAVLFGAAALLALFGRRPPALSPAPPPPAAAVTPLDLLLISGKVEAGRALETSVLTLRDGTDIVLREGTVTSGTRAGEQVTLRLEAGGAFIDSPDRSQPLHVITPQGELLTSDAGLDVRIEGGVTHVTVSHGTATAVGVAYKVELARYDTLDLLASGPRGEPMRIQTEPVVAWAREALDHANLLPNPGFEDGFAHWQADSYPETKVRLDKRSHSGRQAALIEFNAVTEYDHRSPASDPFPITPGKPHRLSGYVEFENLATGPGGGLTIEVEGPDGGKAIASTARFAGTSRWQKFSIDFSPPPDVRELRIVLVHLPDGSPITGKFRLDDLALFRLPGP